MQLNGYNCSIDLDDGTYFASIYGPDGKVLKWYHFDSEREALCYLHSHTAALAKDGQP